jgi:TPR repeat protein
MRLRPKPIVMPQTPLPPGEATRPRDDEIRWFEPVILLPEAAAAVAGSAVPCVASTEAAARGQRARNAIRWVGFAGAPEVPDWTRDDRARDDRARDDWARDDAVQHRARDEAMAQPPAPPPFTDVGGTALAADKVAERPTAPDDADRLPLRQLPPGHLPPGHLPLGRRLGIGSFGLWRLGGAVAIGLIVTFAYHDGERLARLAGAMTRPGAAAGDHSTAPAMPDPTAGEQPAAPVAPNSSSGREATLAAAPSTPAAVQPASEMPEPIARYLDDARAGDPVAQYNLAVVFARGDGLAPDLASAAAWFREAAANGNPAAQFNLGVIYERGLGAATDLAEAIAWYRRAAERDHAAAEYNLAIAYTDGSGMPRDPVAAAHWYRRAAGHGLVPAMVNLAILLEKGEGAALSLPEAYAWYRAAARRGDADAGKRAGELFQHFAGADKAKAVIAAAAVVDALHEPAAEPPAKSAAKSGNGNGKGRVARN